jgi:hypothetical protein
MNSKGHHVRRLMLLWNTLPTNARAPATAAATDSVRLKLKIAFIRLARRRDDFQDPILLSFSSSSFRFGQMQSPGGCFAHRFLPVQAAFN